MGDGDLEESANKQVAGGDGGEMPIFVLRRPLIHNTTQDAQHLSVLAACARVVAHARERYSFKPT